MAATAKMSVEPTVLAWARTTARLPPEEAARRLGVSLSRISEWEIGVASPTINQLRKMADVYHRPLAALFMAEPPSEEPIQQVPDFRRRETRVEVEPRALQKAMFRAIRQQDALREIAAELETSDDSISFPLVLDLGADSEQSGSALRDILELSKFAPAVLSRPDAMLRELIARVESLHVTVIQVQKLDRTTMRGFSLGRGTCPIVALNGADWPRGKIFTLLHELAHVAFHQSGLCDLEEPAGEELERKCNEVAAAALMPRDDFINLTRDGPQLVDSVYARVLASSFGVSAEAALVRMVALRLATWDDYWRLRPDFDQAYIQHKADEKDQANPNSPLFYQLKARDLGRSFVRTVLRAYSEDVLSSRDLTSLLEVKFDQVPKLASRVGEEV